MNAIHVLREVIPLLEYEGLRIMNVLKEL